jgi:predicted ferric reductase
MATFLDLSLISVFDIVFTWILVFSIVFAILQKKGFITENVVLNGSIATVIAFLFALSTPAVQIINTIIPWLTVAIIFGVILLLLFHVFGLKEEKLPDILAEKGVYWTILAVAIIIVLSAVGSVFGQSFTEAAFEGGVAADAAIDSGTSGTATGDFQSNIHAILFNPKVLGLLVIFTIAVFAVFLLTV